MSEQTTGKVLRGMNVVIEALNLEDFPSSKGDLYYAVGDVEVETRDGAYVPVRKILDTISRERFDSPDQAIRAIQIGIDRFRTEKVA